MVLPAPVMPTTAMVWPAGIVEVEVCEDGPFPVREIDGVESHGAAWVVEHDRLVGGRDGEWLFEHAGELFEAGGRGLEEVVELAELLHRPEESS